MSADTETIFDVERRLWRNGEHHAAQRRIQDRLCSRLAAIACARTPDGPHDADRAHLAAAARLPRDVMDGYLAGDRQLDLYEVAAIATYLEVTIDYLMGRQRAAGVKAEEAACLLDAYCLLEYGDRKDVMYHIGRLDRQAERMRGIECSLNRPRRRAGGPA